MTDNTPIVELTQSESNNWVSKFFSSPSEDVSELLVPPIIDIDDLEQKKDQTIIDSSKIENYFKDNKEEIVLFLETEPNSPYEGKKVWDVLSSLGLRWGDMDLFHWENKTNIGDDYYFDVWTFNNPGYFLPEWMAKDEFRLSTLAFGFSVPRTYKPKDVFNSMVKAIEYAQKRLGGKIFTRNRESVDYSVILKNISEIEADLAKINIKPGTDLALRSF